MFMEAFATGFSLSSDSKPGVTLENEKYRIELEEIQCDQTRNIISRGFENCYNWRAVMDLILTATEEAGTDNLIDIEEVTENAVRRWLTTFPGWGLLSSILDNRLHRHVLLSLAYTSTNWDEGTGGEFSEEKVFDTVKYVYDNMPGKELHNLVPKLGVWFEELPVRGEVDQRKKHLSLFLNAKWALEVKFIIEKKRINQSLADLAAEAVVQNILIEEEVEELDIPECLFPRLRTKFADIEWLRSYWSSKEDLEEPEQKPTQELTRSPAEPGAAEEPELPEVQEEVEDVGPEQAEEFLSSVIEELSDVEQIIGGEVGQRTSEHRNRSHSGIDGLLSVWVFVFMILAVIAYVWC